MCRREARYRRQFVWALLFFMIVSACALTYVWVIEPTHVIAARSGYYCRVTNSGGIDFGDCKR